MRRRATASAADDASTEVFDPIDESEQEQIVKRMNDDAYAQMKEMLQIFGYICLLATVACVVLGVTASTKILGLHAMVAAGLHILARYFSSATSATSLWRDAGLMVATFSPMVLLFLLLPSMSLPNNGADASEYHWSLTLGNLLTSVTAVLLKRDQKSTMKAITELRASKYSFKSL